MVISFLVMILLQIFAHAMTAVLPCHVQNFVAINQLELVEKHWKSMSLKF